MRLDVNGSRDINKTEMKTGMQSLGIIMIRDEFEAFWKAIYHAHKRIQSKSRDRSETVNNKQKPTIEEVSFHDLIKAFV